MINIIQSLFENLIESNLPEIISANIASITLIPLLSSKRNMKTSKHVINTETQIGIL
jgi:hypothetical protein